MEETAHYLSLSVDQLKSLIQKQDVERENVTSFDTYKFIPYIEVNHKKLFNKSQTGRTAE